MNEPPFIDRKLLGVLPYELQLKFLAERQKVEKDYLESQAELRKMYLDALAEIAKRESDELVKQNSSKQEA